MHGLFQLIPFTHVGNSFVSLFLVYSISFQVIPSEDMEKGKCNVADRIHSHRTHISARYEFLFFVLGDISPHHYGKPWTSLLSSAMISLTSSCTYFLRIWPWWMPGYHPRRHPSCRSVSLQRTNDVSH